MGIFPVFYSKIFGEASMPLIGKTYPASYLLGINQENELFYLRTDTKTSFPGACYPIGFALLNHNTYYYEGEEDLDNEIVYNEIEGTFVSRKALINRETKRKT